MRSGLRYGLGVLWTAAADGRGGFRGHPGAVPGTSVFNGVDDAGTRAAVVYRTTGPADPAATGALDARGMAFVESAVTG